MTDDTQTQSTEPSTEPTTEAPIATTASVSVPAEASAPVASQPATPARGGGRGSFRPGGHGGRGGGRMGGGRMGGGRGGRGRRGDQPEVESEYDEKNLEISRVTRVTKGGKRMRFRALTVIGNRKGRVGFGVAKGVDVAGATSKAMAQARKALITVPMMNETIPHMVLAKFAAARVLLKPAPKGAGIKAGGAVRVVLELAGVPNVVSKMQGSASKINNVKATFQALKRLKIPASATKPIDDQTARRSST